MPDRNLSLQLASALQPHVKQRNRVNQQLFIGTIGGAPINYNDTPSTYIKDGYEYNADVYSVVNMITRAAAAVPPLVLEVKDEKHARQYYRMKHGARNGVTDGYAEKLEKVRTKAFEEVSEDDDLYRLIDRPNPLQAFPEFLENFWGFWEITGNAYAHGVELSDGRFSELWVMPSQLTKIKADKSIESLVKSYILDTYGYDQDIPPETVLHVKYWNPDYTMPGSHLYGMSPLRAARVMLRASNDGAMALASSFRNMGATGMAFPDDKDVEQLTEEQRSGLQREIQQASGPRNAKSVLVTSVKMGWQSFGMSPVDLEILNTINATTRQICNIYGVSSELLNDPENKTQANKKEARRGLYMDNVIPKLERVYSELNRFLVPRFNAVSSKKYHITYDVSAIDALSEDIAKKVEWLNRAWVVTGNEFREALDYDRSDDPMMDVPLVPAGRMPISDLSGALPADIELSEAIANYATKKR